MTATKVSSDRFEVSRIWLTRLAKTPKATTTGSPVKITAAAQRNHEELFPNHQSTLKATDPELIEIFDNFALDEVLAKSKLDTKTRTMMILASLIACQAVSEYRIMTGAALDVGVTPVQIKEILYQSIPYVGMAGAFEFLHATNGVLTNRGIALPLEAQSTTTRETRYEKGLAVQKAIFGASIDQLYQQSPKDQRHIQRFLSAHCFGDHYSRAKAKSYAISVDTLANYAGKVAIWMATTSFAS